MPPGMPPGMPPSMAAGVPPLMLPGQGWPMTGMPPWSMAAPGMNAAIPPWMMAPQVGGTAPGPSPLISAGLPMSIPAEMAPSMAQGNNDSSNPDACALRLRGLPFTCSEQEVYAFFSKHDVVEYIADVDNAVEFLTQNNGKPSGQAKIQMTSKADAEITQQALHGQWIGSRFIEVFSYVEHNAVAAKGRSGKAAQAGIPEPEPDVPSAGDTGGSGSPAPFQQGAWSPGSDQEYAAMMSMVNAGTGDACSAQVGMNAMAGPGGEGSWEALFDFLKKDGAVPTMQGNPPHGQVNPA